jgi:hypothetical protein
MNKLSFEAYQQSTLETAYYLDESSANQHDIIYYGFNEEVNELLTDNKYPQEYTALLRGMSLSPRTKESLKIAKESEIGDVIYYISAAASIRDIKLGSIAGKATELFTGDDHHPVSIFTELDEPLKDKLAQKVSARYSPNYFGMQMFNLPPFEDINSGTLEKLDEIEGPLTLTADGLYAFERISRRLSEELRTPKSGADFEIAAALTLGALSVIAQGRLAITLEEAAAYNITKRERRALAHTLSEGWDSERSRATGTLRPQLDGFKNTQVNLLGFSLE